MSAAPQHGGEAGRRRRVVVLVGPGNATTSARDIVRQPLHVVDLGRQQQLADIAETASG